MRQATGRALAGATALGALILLAAAGPQEEPAKTLTPEQRRELLFEHRNLGKALYENPTTQYQAVAELRKALELRPGLGPRPGEPGARPAARRQDR